MKLKYYSFYGKSFISNLIKFWTRSEISHIAIGLPDKSLYNMVEAWIYNGNKFKVRWGYSTFNNHKKGTKYDVWELEVSEKMYKYCMGKYYMYAYRQKKYDWKSLLNFILKGRGENKKGAICSEGAIRPVVEFKKFTSIKPSEVSPKVFIQVIEAMGAIKTANKRV